MANRSEVKIRPLPGGQQIFLSRCEDEVLFGGAAGPGKSYALCVDAIGPQYGHTLGKKAVDIPEYRAVLFRRETPQLGKLIDITNTIYPRMGAKFAAQRRGEPGICWDFPSGAKIYLCHLENENNKYSHDGFEYQYIGFDELTQFTLTQYLHLISRGRTTIPGLNIRIRSTSNPIGEGLWWVRKRFPVNEPYKTYSYLASDNPDDDPAGRIVPFGTKYSMSRIFIPGKLSENTYLNVDDYMSRLKAGGVQKENALLHGDWDAFGGDFFASFDRSTEVIDPFEIPAQWGLTLSVDPGWGGVCAAGIHAYDFDGNVYRICSYYERAKNPEQNAEGIREMVESCKYTQGRMPETCVSGRDAWAQKDRNSILASDRTFADVFESNGINLTPAITNRHNGWGTLRGLMPDHFFVFKTGNDSFLAEMSTAVTDSRDVEDIAGKGNDSDVPDHNLDDCRYNVMASYKAVKPPPPDPRPSWLIEFAQKQTHSERYEVGMD